MHRLGIDPAIADLMTALDEDTQAATALVMLAQAAADHRLRRRYAIKWWSEFLPQRVTLAARTSATLSEFSAELARRLGSVGQIGAYEAVGGRAHRAVWLELIGLPMSRQRRILDILEQQAAVCCTLVRADIDAKREAHNGTTEDSGTSGEIGGGPGLFDGDSAAVPGDAIPEPDAEFTV